MSRLWIYVLCSVVICASLGDESGDEALLRALLGDEASFEKLEEASYPPFNESTDPVTEETPEVIVRRFRIPILDDLKDILKHEVDSVSGIIQDSNLLVNSAVNKPMSDVCYQFVGCFSMKSPWRSFLRPVPPPMSPEVINASAKLFTRENYWNPNTIKLYPEVEMEESEFNPDRVTVIMVHGFANTGEAQWLKDMATSYLGARDANVFVVDWGDGARRWDYLQVSGNTRVVGRELAILVKTLIKDYAAVPTNFHLIGHSLGAHICSYVAKEVPGIRHLTALDPAQPGFEGFSKKVRLDKSDAEFVEVLHTQAKPFIPALGFGMITPHGDVDYYFNGGFSQPGCPLPKPKIIVRDLRSLGKIPVELLTEFISCDHSRAYLYYTEALKSDTCTIWGRPLRIFNLLQASTNLLTQGLFQLKDRTPCTLKACIPLGLEAINSSLRGTFLVLTANSPPYCINNK